MLRCFVWLDKAKFDNGHEKSSFYRTTETTSLVWLLSNDSKWMPEQARTVLLTGMREWAVWHWHKPNFEEQELGLTAYDNIGALQKNLFRCDHDDLVITPEARYDVTMRIEQSRILLSLPETTDDLVQRFLSCGFIESAWKEQKAGRQERRKKSD